MSTKPSIPRGTRDFLPAQSLRRQHIFDTARTVFRLYGYQPIETPAMENLETLMGKYGEEGDRLIYRILNSGNFVEGISDGNIQDLVKNFESRAHEASAKILRDNITDKALRYDLTVPFARFVVQNQNELTFPFKRYQMQPVWRADRPQKGRYREFYQLDVDVIGSDSLLNESELLCIVHEVFTRLKLPDIIIRINNRKILSGIAESAGLSGYFTDMTVAIDKLDKIGVDEVRDEMLKRGLPEAGVKKALNLIKLTGKPDDMLSMLANAMVGVQEAHKGIDEVRSVLKALPEEVKKCVQVDLTLARGLNYYTGAIIEVGHPAFGSSICGGGRYDDLTGVFGLKGMSGVGVSFGADRIYDLLEELKLFPENLQAGGDVLFVNFGEAEARACLKLAASLRSSGISSEVYPDSAKMQKQMKYADSLAFPFVVLIGGDELKAGNATVKNMKSGAQVSLAQSELVKFFTSNRT